MGNVGKALSCRMGSNDFQCVVSQLPAVDFGDSEESFQSSPEWSVLCWSLKLIGLSGAHLLCLGKYTMYQCNAAFRAKFNSRKFRPFQCDNYFTSTHWSLAFVQRFHDVLWFLLGWGHERCKAHCRCSAWPGRCGLYLDSQRHEDS